METLTGRVDDTPAAREHGSEAADRVERQIGKPVGMKQFGVNHLTLHPGGASSRRHWHQREDEFVYVLSGVVVLVDDNGEHAIAAGGFVGFPAGAPNAHHFVNRSATPAELFVVGTRQVGEERIHYPDQADPGPFSVFRDAAGNRTV